MGCTSIRSNGTGPIMKVNCLQETTGGQTWYTIRLKGSFSPSVFPLCLGIFPASHVPSRFNMRQNFLLRLIPDRLILAADCIKR
jgi:hypothetical protein